MLLSIKTKSTVILIAAFALVFCVGVYGAWQIEIVTSQAFDIRDNWLPATRDLGEIKYIVTRIRLSTARELMTADPTQTADLKQKDADLDASMEATSKHYERTIAGPAEQALWDRFKHLWQAYRLEQDSVLAQAAVGREGAIKAFNTNTVRRFDAALAALDAGIAFNDRGAMASGARAQATYKKSLLVTTAGIVFALIFMLGAGFLISKDVVLPLMRVTGCMKKVAEGDLETGIPYVDRQDEIGAMASQLQVFKSNLIAGQAAERAAETKNKKLLESERKYREVFDHVSDAIFLFDLSDDGGFVLSDLNPAAEEIGGVVRAHVAGRRFGEAGMEDMAKQMEPPFRRCAETGLPVTFEKLVQFSTGFHLLNTVLLPVRQEPNSIYRLIAFSSDITERRRAEEEVLKLNQELELRVAQRTAALEQVNRELESFVYSIAHDLRAPLRAIDGFSRILLDEHSGELGEDVERQLNVIRRSALRVAKQIDDLLDFSFLSRRQMEKVEVDVAALAQTVFDQLRATKPERNICLRMGELPPAVCDRDMIRQVLASLLSNAIKFTGLRSEAAIEVTGAAGKEENIYSVSDNGAGFDMRYAGKLFGIFQRLHGIDEFEGTGIGLAIVKRIVERHGGRVWAEGKVDEGATIHFTIPR